MRTKLPALLTAALTLAAMPAAALAAVAGQEAPRESNLGFLLAGTLLTWAGFFAYALYVGRKSRDLRREVEDLRERLAEREQGAALDGPARPERQR